MSGFADAYFNRARSVIHAAEERNCKFQLIDAVPNLQFKGAGPALEMLQYFLQIDFLTRKTSKFMVYAPNELAHDLKKVGVQLNDNVYVIERKHLQEMCECELKQPHMLEFEHKKVLLNLNFGYIPWRVRAIPKGAPEDISLFETSPMKLSVPPLAQDPYYVLTDIIDESCGEKVTHLRAIERAIEKCKKMYGSAPAILTPGFTMQGSRLDPNYR